MSIPTTISDRLSAKVDRKANIQPSERVNRVELYGNAKKRREFPKNFAQKLCVCETPSNNQYSLKQTDFRCSVSENP
jgi:hypothetical protein